MIPQLNKITHTKKVAALSIVIVVSFSRMERVGRVELRDLQLGRLLVAPSPVYLHTVIIQQTTGLVYIVWQGR